MNNVHDHGLRALKSAARSAVEARRAQLIELSHRISALAELAFAEHESARIITATLEDVGLSVSGFNGELDTAFVATTGSGELNLAVCAEYDALPDIGHACGHNIIAASAVGAAVALAEAADAVGLTLRVIGTPAEEIGDAGGKIKLLEQGAFDGTHAALMIHPAPENVLMNTFYAISTFDVLYHGRASHAAAYPELGINAADALTIAQVAIGLLRQQLPADVLIHGIVTGGGEAPNIIPGEVSARYMVRAPTLEALHEAKKRVLGCFQAGATATGARLEIVGGNSPYAEVRHDREIAEIFAANWTTLGHGFEPTPNLRPGASTDLGNVSRVLPCIHPMVSIRAEPGVANHHPSFAAASVAPPADQTLIDSAIALAWTALDVATSAPIRQRLLQTGGYRADRRQHEQFTSTEGDRS